MTLPEPELEVGADGAADTPLPDVLLELLPDFELPDFELPEPEPEVLEPELVELPEEPVPVDPVLVDPVLVEPPDEEPVLDELLELLPVPDVLAELEAAPGRAKATAPAATALTTPAVTVTARSRLCPRSRAAMARRVSCGGPFMGGVPVSLAS